MLRLHLLLVVSVVLLRDEQHAVGAVVRTGGICSLLCGREQDRERGSVNYSRSGDASGDATNHVVETIDIPPPHHESMPRESMMADCGFCCSSSKASQINFVLKRGDAEAEKQLRDLLTKRPGSLDKPLAIAVEPAFLPTGLRNHNSGVRDHSPRNGGADRLHDERVAKKRTAWPRSGFYWPAATVVFAEGMIPGKVEVPSISSEEALNRPTRSSSTSTWSSDSATQSLPGIRGRIFRRDSVSEAMDTNSNDDAHAASDEPQNWKQDLVQQIRDTCKNGGCCPSTLSCCIGRSSACSNTKASVTSL